MMATTIHTGDCLDVLGGMAAESVDAVVTDPPYGLEFMSVAWDTFNHPKGKGRTPNTWGDHGSKEHARTSDSAARVNRNKALAYQEAMAGWLPLALRVLKPGGHLLAFGGTRTYHRLTCAIEDAGFEIRDCIMWLHGQGFPKSKAHLKPAYEPIIMARKPCVGSMAATVERYGTGALNIEACRVGVSKDVPASISRKVQTNCYGKFPEYGEIPGAGGHDPNLGRWPANVTHDGSDEVVALFPMTNNGGQNTTSIKGRGMFMDGSDAGTTRFSGDAGSAARFYYTAKASKSDRDDGLYWSHRGNHHPTCKPTELMRWLCRLITPPDGVILDPFMGSGSTGKAAVIEGFSFIGIEREAEYVEIARARIIQAQGPLFADVGD